MQVAHIPDEVAQAWMVKATDAHLVLLELIAAEDDQLGGLVLAQHDLDEFFTERPGTTGDQDNLFAPIHCYTSLQQPMSFRTS